MTTSYLIASVAGQRIAIGATSIDAIIKLDAIHPVPGAPPHVAGLCAVRSSVMTVIDIAKIVGGADSDDARHAVIVQHDGHRYALRVDHVSDVEAVALAPRTSDPSIGRQWHALAGSHVETSFGTALILDVGRVVSGTASIH
jgi:purine-binding chemotaxis protein CheW